MGVARRARAYLCVRGKITAAPRSAQKRPLEGAPARSPGQLSGGSACRNLCARSALLLIAPPPEAYADDALMALMAP